jgi:hypothetical protein
VTSNINHHHEASPGCPRCENRLILTRFAPSTRHGYIPTRDPRVSATAAQYSVVTDLECRLPFS